MHQQAQTLQALAVGFVCLSQLTLPTIAWATDPVPFRDITRDNMRDSFTMPNNLNPGAVMKHNMDSAIEYGPGFGIKNRPITEEDIEAPPDPELDDIRIEDTTVQGQVQTQIQTPPAETPSDTNKAE